MKRWLPFLLFLLLAGTASAGLITIAGGRGVAQSSGDAAAEFAAECSDASMCTSFETTGEVLDYTLADFWGTSGYVTRDSTHAFSGSYAMRMHIPSDTNNGGNWGRHIDDAFGLNTGEGMQTGGPANFSTDQGIDEGETFEVAFLMYLPADQTRSSIDDAGGKYSILSHDSQTNRPFEIVWQNSLYEAVITGYYRNPPNTTGWEEPVSTACNASDFIRQPASLKAANVLTGIAAVNPDNGMAWTNCQLSWGRGYMYSYRQANYPDAKPGTRRWKHWDLQADNLPIGSEQLGSAMFPEDDWIALKLCVEVVSYSAATNIIHWYAGNRYNTDWAEINTDTNALLPPANAFGYDERYNQIWLTPRRALADGVITTDLWYDNVIAKRDTDCTAIGFPQTWPAL